METEHPSRGLVSFRNFNAFSSLATETLRSFLAEADLDSKTGILPSLKWVVATPRVRREALTDSLLELMGSAGVDMLNFDQMRPELNTKLQRLKEESGLSQETCFGVVARLSQLGDLAQEKLNERSTQLQKELGLQKLL